MTDDVMTDDRHSEVEVEPRTAGEQHTFDVYCLSGGKLTAQHIVEAVDHADARRAGQQCDVLASMKRRATR